MDELGSRIYKKADKEETERLWKETKRFPTNVDFKDLYNRTLVPMKEHQEVM